MTHELRATMNRLAVELYRGLQRPRRILIGVRAIGLHRPCSHVTVVVIVVSSLHYEPLWKSQAWFGNGLVDAED